MNNIIENCTEAFVIAQFAKQPQSHTGRTLSRAHTTRMMIRFAYPILCVLLLLVDLPFVVLL